jgi:hypothetical protein
MSWRRQDSFLERCEYGMQERVTKFSEQWIPREIGFEREKKTS